MAKRRRKKPQQPKNRKGGPSINTNDPAKVLQMAKADLAAGNGRRAREGFRRLLRLGDKTALDGYLEATGLYLETLFQEGREKLVADVLVQVRSLAGDRGEAWCEPWALRLSMGEGDWEANARRALAHLASGAHAPWAVDVVVLGFESLEGEDALACDARSVYEGLVALVARNVDGVEAALRGIGRRSPFASWKWLLKGWVRLLDPDGAAVACRCFENVGTTGVPGRAAAIMLGLYGVGSLQASEIEGACHWLGESDLAKVLPEVEASWNKGAIGRGYAALVKTGSFPRFEASLLGDLSALFLVKPMLTGRRYDDFVEGLISRVMSQNFRDAHEKAWLSRWAGIGFPPGESLSILERHWLDFLEGYEALHGPHRALAARVHELLARRVFDKVCRGRPQGREASFIVHHCERSTKYDSSRFAPYQLWLSTLKSWGKKPERKRLLGKLAKAFPEEKSVILEAADEAWVSKAYVKTLGLAKKALSLDPLDLGARELCIAANVMLAQREYSRGKISAGRKRFDEMRGYAREESVDPHFCAAHMFLQQAALETDKKMRASCEEAAREKLSPIVFRFVSSFFTQAFRGTGRRPSEISFKRDVKKSDSLTSEDAVSIARFLKRNDHARSEPFFRDQEIFLESFLHELSKRGKLRREDARELIFLLEVESDWLCLEPDIIERARREWPDDPLFALFILGEEVGPPQELKQWIARAKEARDHRAIEYGEWLETDMDDEDDEDPWDVSPFPVRDWIDDDDDDDDDFPPMGEGFGIGPGDLEAILLLKGAPDEMLDLACRELGIGRMELDVLIMMAGLGEGSRGFPRKKAAKKKIPTKKMAPKKKAPPKKQVSPREKPRLDFDHPDLFDGL